MAEMQSIQNIHNKKKRKIWIIAACIAVLAAMIIFFIIRPFFHKQSNETENTAAVIRGTIVNTIEGTGEIEAIDQYTISALVTGEVLSDYFAEGDLVKKDDLLYVIDSTNMDYNIQKAESGVESAQIAYEESLDNQAKQTVTAPISGIISEMYVKDGDTLQVGSRIMEITDTSSMVLTLDFLSSDAAQIRIGDAALVVPVNAPAEHLNGAVTNVASGQRANSLGALVTSVEIEVENPGGILPETAATATIGNFACNAAGTFSSHAERTVLAQTGGDVTGLSLHKGDFVSAGSVLLYLKSEATDRSVSRSRISLNDAVAGRSNAYDQLDDYRIRAPITGKVIQKSVKAGDKLVSGANSNMSSMAIIADLSTLVFEMSVDELDISKVKEGQEVRVTADALDGEVFIGHVDNVSIVGTAANGVTTYPVKVVLDGETNAALIPGMNVNATIVIESRENILMIPTEAITRGNIVTVKGEGSEKAPNLSDDMTADEKTGARTMREKAPDGYHYVRVNTGITDGQYIEVSGGLSEGDIILLPATAGDKSTGMTYTENANMRAMGGMPGGGMNGMGGMPGGMPGGGNMEARPGNTGSR